MSQPGLLILDTNVVIHLIRGSELARHVDEQFGLRDSPERPLVSVVTVGEARAFASRNGWGQQRIDQLYEHIRQLVIVDINNEPVLRSYAEIDVFAKQNGHALSNNDTWIAATARATGARLLTTDLDFDPLDPSFIKRTWFDPNTRSLSVRATGDP
jgi:predicted nucleic acid-binding protein